MFPPEVLRARLGSGLLAFPATNFHADGAFYENAYRSAIRRNVAAGAAALFAPGGTGEFFSLSLAEVRRVTSAAVATAGGRVPVIGGCGYGTAMAVEFARAAQDCGADGILVLPQYLLTAEQAGLERHLETICRAVQIGVIVYNRDNCIVSAETLARVAERCPNLIGFKDGQGDVEHLVRVRRTLGDRLVYIGGMPTAEVFAAPYLAAGFTTYSSAVFNFVPRMAMRFYEATLAGDAATTDRLLDSFFLPYVALRNRRRGYAVSIVKAGMRLTGLCPGPVRAPLIDLDEAETQELAAILDGALGDDIG